jgi:hypothetical protein
MPSPAEKRHHLLELGYCCSSHGILLLLLLLPLSPPRLLLLRQNLNQFSSLLYPRLRCFLNRLITTHKLFFHLLLLLLFLLACCCSLRNTYKAPSTKPAPLLKDLLKEVTKHSLPRLSAPASLSRETKPPKQQPQQQCKQGFYSRQQALEKTLKHNELQQSMIPISSSSSSRFFFSSFSSFTNRARAWKHEQQNHGWLDFFTYGQQKWKRNSNNKITETHPQNPKTHNKTTQLNPNPKTKNYQTKPKPKPKPQKKKTQPKPIGTKPKEKKKAKSISNQNTTSRKTRQYNNTRQRKYKTRTQDWRWWQKRRRVRTQL